MEILFGILMFFLPTGIAFARGLQNRWWILLINIFLGWTVIFWVGILLWSILSKTY